jgi:hypothetical protein
MNPFQWLKAVYETFGTPYPRASLVVVTIFGAILFAAAWIFTCKQVEKDRHNSNAPPQVSGPASTTGDKSPAVTGNGNDIKYDQSSPPEKEPEPPKKE